ncbi:MAG: sensor histidine kinase, partial [Dehalococcoidia bacterium]|nr:sensor histidine kinase [Dehalococcoidia bacterium]
GFDSESAFASADGHHLGLLGLKERVDLVGGTFGIESSPEHGTTITVDVPRHVDGEVEIEPD